VQTFLSSSSPRPPHPRLCAPRPASPPSSLPRGPRARGSSRQRGLRPHPALGASAASPWPRRAGAPRGPRASPPGRRRRPRSPHQRPRLSRRRPPRAGCPGTPAPAAAPRATSRPPAGAARSGSTSPAQVSAAWARAREGRLRAGGDASWPLAGREAGADHPSPPPPARLRPSAEPAKARRSVGARLARASALCGLCRFAGLVHQEEEPPRYSARLLSLRRVRSSHFRGWGSCRSWELSPLLTLLKYFGVC
jgi:hypothetical protein